MNSSSSSPTTTSTTSPIATGGDSSAGTGEIPIEIVSEEEMALIEAALAVTLPMISSSSCSSSSSSLSAQRPMKSSIGMKSPDIEDFRPSRARGSSLLQRFRSGRGLAVTDITATEWCEKQMEFVLLQGKPKPTRAMVAGTDRHYQLEKEVLEKVEVPIEAVEESWALKLMNFIVGANQLLFEGLTRELPLFGFVKGIWMIGVIDELRLPEDGLSVSPFIVDTKTRYKATPPTQAQKRNGRFQIMCYKHLWDSMVSNTFPTDQFLNHFDLNRQYALSGDLKEYIASLGFNAETFKDVLDYYLETCHLLSPCQEQLLLRYELQSDHSLLEEHFFTYDATWCHEQLQECLNFWSGTREASYVSDDEKWKCCFCAFSSICPMMTALSNFTS